MAERFEEVIGLRVSALEAQVAVEVKSVKEHFVELREFITFSLTQQISQLRSEFKLDLGRVEQRLEQKVDANHEAIAQLNRKVDGYHETLMRLDRKVEGLDRKVEGLDRKVDVHHGAIAQLDRKVDGQHTAIAQLERKVDAHHDAMTQALAVILSRLPAAPG